MARAHSSIGRPVSEAAKDGAASSCKPGSISSDVFQYFSVEHFETLLPDSFSECRLGALRRLSILWQVHSVPSADNVSDSWSQVPTALDASEWHDR